MISRRRHLHLRDRSLLRDLRKVEQRAAAAAAQLHLQMGRIPLLMPGTGSFFHDPRRSHR